MTKKYGKLRNLINLCVQVGKKIPESLWAKSFSMHSDDPKLIRELFPEEEAEITGRRESEGLKASDYENIMTGWADGSELLKLYCGKLRSNEKLQAEILRIEKMIERYFESEHERKEFAELMDDFLGEKYGVMFPVARDSDLKKQKKEIEKVESDLQKEQAKREESIGEKAHTYYDNYEKGKKTASDVYEDLQDVLHIKKLGELEKLKCPERSEWGNGNLENEFRDEIKKEKYSQFILDLILDYLGEKCERLRESDSQDNNELSNIKDLERKKSIIENERFEKEEEPKECFRKLAKYNVECEIRKKERLVEEEKNKLLPYLITSNYIDDPMEEKKYIIRTMIDLTSPDCSAQEIGSYAEFEEAFEKSGSFVVVKQKDEYCILLKYPDQPYTGYLSNNKYVEVEMKRNSSPMSYYRKLYHAIENPLTRAAYGLLILLSSNRYEEMFRILFGKDVYKQIEELYVRKSYRECAEMMESLGQNIEREKEDRYTYIDYIKAKLIEKQYLPKGRMDVELLYKNCFKYIEKKRKEYVDSDYFAGAACCELARISLKRNSKDDFIKYVNAAGKGGYYEVYDFLGDLYYRAYKNFNDGEFAVEIMKRIRIDNSTEFKALSADCIPVVAKGMVDKVAKNCIKRSIICYFLADQYSSYHKIRRILQTLKQEGKEYPEAWYKEAEKRLEGLAESQGHMIYPDLEGMRYLSGDGIKRWIEKDETIKEVDSETEIETYIVYGAGKKTEIFLESLDAETEKRIIILNVENEVSLHEVCKAQVIDCTSAEVVKNMILSLKYFRLHREKHLGNEICEALEKGKNKYHFIALEDDMEANVQFAKIVMEHICGYVHTAFAGFNLEEIKEKFLEVCDLVLNVDSITVEMVLDPVQNSFGDFFVKTRYVSYDYEISKQLLLNQPLFAPQLAMRGKGFNQEILDVIVLGNDKSIPILVKNILSVAYMPRGVRAYKVRVTVVENKTRVFQNQLMMECPGIFEMGEENGTSYMYDVEFADSSFDSYEFRQTFSWKKSDFTNEQKALRKKIDNCRYFVCAMQTDGESVAWGRQIRQWLYQKDASFDEAVSISVLCRNELYASQVGNIRVGDINVAPMWFANYNLNVYGQEKFCFGRDNIYHDFISGIQHAVFEGDRETYDKKSLTYITEGEKVFNIRKNKYYSSWYDRDSADMRNLYFIYRLYSAGVFDEWTKWDYNRFLSNIKECAELYDKKLEGFKDIRDLMTDFLSRNEHHRWVGFMLSRGWQCPPDFDYVESYMDKGNPEYKCAIAKLHPAIRPYEQLGDQKCEEDPENDALMQVKIDRLKEAHGFSVSRKSVKRYNAEAIQDSANWLKYYERKKGVL